MPEQHEPYLRPTPTVDADHPQVQRFAAEHAGDGVPPREQAVALYYAVRDGIRYDPYRIDLSVTGLRASTVLSNRYGWCVPKAALLAACCRARNIPAAVGFADVRNHLSTERMRQVMGTDVFYWHGYTSIFLDGQWVKATPAFNIELCEKFRLHPLAFDGRADSIYHPYDLDGHRHMEYLHMRGEFADVPLEEMRATFDHYYPRLVEAAGADFDADVAREAPAS
ncbi:transglutaminase family protein [Ectothiorhodospiraceae bacterium WFHF3C12]|nr:transglutaminase family protein [Ectothiorhodospiraceae bacterium WFHF3C12]